MKIFNLKDPEKILNDILSDKINRITLVVQFQEYISNGKPTFNNRLEENILRDLAYNLDYYQPDENLRAQDERYYGDEELEEEIKSIIQELKNE